jgi:hypothetical protein
LALPASACSAVGEPLRLTTLAYAAAVVATVVIGQRMGCGAIDRGGL